jgi:hypothetical protein
MELMSATISISLGDSGSADSDSSDSHIGHLLNISSIPTRENNLVIAF